MADENGTNTDRLLGFLDFDPAKKSLGQGTIASALEELQAEQVKANKDRAKEILKKAMDLRVKMEAAKRQFEAEYMKFDKELGKILSQLGAAVGQPQQPVSDELAASPDAGDPS